MLVHTFTPVVGYSGLAHFSPSCHSRPRRDIEFKPEVCLRKLMSPKELFDGRWLFSLSSFISNLLPSFVFLPRATLDWQFKMFVLFIVLFFFLFPFSELEVCDLNNKSYFDIRKTGQEFVFIMYCHNSGLFLFFFILLIICEKLLLELRPSFMQ